MQPNNSTEAMNLLSEVFKELLTTFSEDTKQIKEIRDFMVENVQYKEILVNTWSQQVKKAEYLEKSKYLCLAHEVVIVSDPYRILFIPKFDRLFTDLANIHHTHMISRVREILNLWNMEETYKVQTVEDWTKKYETRWKNTCGCEVDEFYFQQTRGSSFEWQKAKIQRYLEKQEIIAKKKREELQKLKRDRVMKYNQELKEILSVVAKKEEEKKKATSATINKGRVKLFKSPKDPRKVKYVIRRKRKILDI